MRIRPSAPIPVLLVHNVLICSGDNLKERPLLSITIKSLPAPDSLLNVISILIKIFWVEKFSVAGQQTKILEASAFMLYNKTIAH